MALFILFIVLEGEAMLITDVLLQRLLIARVLAIEVRIATQRHSSPLLVTKHVFSNLVELH